MKNKYLFTALLAVLASCQVIVAQPGIIACYPLDNNANDYSGNNYHGIAYNVTPAADRNGNANAACHFSGTNSYIEINDSAFHLNSYTYSVWCRLTAYPPSGEAACVFGIGEEANQSILIGNSYWFSSYSAIGFVSSINPGSDQFCFSSVYPNLNQWYHLTVTRSADSMKLYVDTSYECFGVTSYNPSYANSPSAARIGRRPGSSILPQYFTGDIDELKIFNRALSATEIAGIGNNCLPSGLHEEFIHAQSSDFYYDPASCEIRFDMNNLKNQGVDRVEVYNVTGQKIFTVKFPVSSLSTTAFTKGLFLIKAHRRSGLVITSKIVID